MELAFETQELRNLCEIKDVGESELGEEQASELRQCLADWASTKCLADLPDPPILKNGQFTTKTISGLEIVFVSNYPKRAEELKLNKIFRLKILTIKK